MSNDFVVEATRRDDTGKGASRRLRRSEGLVPAILYGGKGKEPVCLSVKSNELRKSLENEAFYSHILTLKFDGQEEQAILKDMQRHPAKNHVTHCDFMRVTAGEPINVHVPLHFINEKKCAAIRDHGGIASHHVVEIEIHCLPSKLPEFIEVDMQNIEMDQILHLADVQLPEGVTVPGLVAGSDSDIAVVSIHKSRAATETDSEEDEAETPED